MVLVVLIYYQKMLKKIFLLLLLGGIFVVAFVFYSKHTVQAYSEYCYFNTHEIPKNKVGLVLGTAKHLDRGYINKYYQGRVEAAIELFNAGRVEFLLISGDNGRKDYNEPEEFQQDLIKAGIPKEKIFLDYAGFRTLDSVIRAREIFGQSKFTIISQPFHNERAVFLARQNNMDAIAYNATDYSGNLARKVKMRERLAVVKAVLDVWVLGTEPRYLGNRIEIK